MSIETLDVTKGEMVVECGNCAKTFTEKIKKNWTSKKSVGQFYENYVCDPCPNCGGMVHLNMNMPSRADVLKEFAVDDQLIYQMQTVNGNEPDNQKEAQKLKEFKDKHLQRVDHVHALIALVREDKKGAKTP